MSADTPYDRLVARGSFLAQRQAPERRCPKCGETELAGVIVRGVYDGVLYWRCPTDGTPVHRWEEIGPSSRLHDAARKHMAATGDAS